MMCWILFVDLAKASFIWFSPPCTPWSNATPLTKQETPEYIKMGKLCEFTIQLVKKMTPRAFILEKPYHKTLIHQPYMQGVKLFHCSYCQYGMSYLKDTTLWCLDSLNSDLRTCTCTGPHAVKLGGDCGGNAGCKRFANKQIEGQVPNYLSCSLSKN